MSLLLSQLGPPPAQIEYTPDDDFPIEVEVADLFVSQDDPPFGGLVPMAFDEELLVEVSFHDAGEEDPLVPIMVGAFVEDADLLEPETFETFYEEDLPFVAEEEEEIVWLAEDERLEDEIIEVFQEDQTILPALVSFDPMQIDYVDPPGGEATADTEDAFISIVPHIDADDEILDARGYEVIHIPEDLNFTPAPYLPDEQNALLESLEITLLEEEVLIEFVPSVIIESDPEVEPPSEIERDFDEEVVGQLIVPFAWSSELEEHPNEEDLWVYPEEEILVPEPPPVPPLPPTPEPPIQGGSLPGGAGGRTQVWTLGTPSKRYVNFAKRPAPRYPYDFWQKLSEPTAPRDLPKRSAPSAPREIRWMQRFERTLQKDPQDARPLYSRLVDLLRKKR